ncbi:MAG TPA: FecR domain-containing protein [Burkholderiales bacterium]|nr:FecR domain-containing protein [Burkholderiales bacterium]
MLRSVALAVFFVVFATLPAHAAKAPVPAGKVDFVTGETWFIDASQQRRRPVQGDLLFVTDTISTGTDGEVHLDMEDGGYMAVRSNTLLKVQEFRTRGDESDRGVLTLIKGTLRSFTGWIARQGPKAYVINTVTATIGIRGTDHEPLFIPAGSNLGEPGTYDKVNEGATFIEHASGIVEVLPNTAGFAPLAAGAKARLLDRVPDFFRPSANEHLLAGRHKLVQDRLQEKLDARRRLNQSRPPESEPPGGQSSELQETPLNPDTKPDARDAPGSTLPNIPPVLPPAGATAVPALAVPPAVPGGAVAPALTSVPRAPAVPAPAAGAPAVSPASAAPGVPAAPAPTGAPSVPKPPASATVPSVPRTTRSEGRPSRVVPGAGRPESDTERPRAESTKPVVEDRTKTLSERRRQQQEDRRGQFDRDRELGHKRDNE